MLFCVMDSSPRAPASRSPRRGLRGDRPTMLSVHGSRSFKKLPMMGVLPLPGKVPEGGHPRRPPPPVIIHEVSPEVIHVLPEVFKETVQRLTGRSSNPSFGVHNKQVRRVPDVTRAETSASMFRIEPSLGFSVESATDNMLIPSSGANQEFSFYNMWPEFDGDNPTTTTYDTGAPSQSLDDIFRF